MKIAILTYGTPYDKKGSFNATHQRIKHLILQGFEVDVFIIRYYENFFIQTLRKKKYQKINKDDFFIYDDVKYNNLWIYFSVFDYFQWQKLNQLGSKFTQFAKKTSRVFAPYELISVHSFEPGIIAYYAKKFYDVPYAITWHGSDIHEMPKSNTAIKKMTNTICKHASLVFFVSKQLQNESRLLGIEVDSHILHNAVNRDQFKPYTPERKQQLKQLKHIDGKCNVAFIGGLVGIKNVEQLPYIFRKIADNLEDIRFYFIGDGNLRTIVSKKCNELTLDAVFFGNRPVEEMADLINCFDLVVLPSHNEGFPLIVLECLSCAVPIVCSRVGGIPEVLSDELTVVPGPGFIDRFASLAVEVLKNSDKGIAKLPPEFSWETTGRKEAILYQKFLSQNIKE